MLYAHWSAAPWDGARWPSFTAREVACRASGEYFHDPASFDALQRARDALGAPLRVTSGHRSAAHNAAIGGAPLSAHLAFAADVALDGRDPRALCEAARAAGFSSFGFYTTFIHLDRRRPARRWFGSHEAKERWTTLSVSTR